MKLLPRRLKTNNKHMDLAQTSATVKGDMRWYNTWSLI